jgi:predicted DNA-binding transcriptional regulator AlpA
MNKKPDGYAYPPRGMRRETAARYVGVSTTKFDEMVADGRMPKPKRVDKAVIWDRIQLDAAFSDLPEKVVNPLDRMLEASGSDAAVLGAANFERRKLPAAIACSTELIQNRLRGQSGAAGYDTNAYERFLKREINFSDLPPGRYPDGRVYAEGEWEELVRKSPLTKLERLALGGYVRAKGTLGYVKGAGPATNERLETRGFISIVKERGKDREPYRGVTPAGEAEWCRLDSEK